MRRRDILGVVAIAGWPRAYEVLAQEKVPVIGFIQPTLRSGPAYEAFRRELSQLGYIEGRSVRLEPRFVGAREELASEAVRDLLRIGVDVIVTEGRSATLAAKGAAPAVPIVMAPVGDARDFVLHFARPEGNLTGLSMQQDDTDAKLVSLLKEVTPSLSRLGIVQRPSGNADAVVEVAKALHLDTFVVEISGPDGVEAAFSEVAARGADGAVIIHTAGFYAVIEQIAASANRHRLPAAASAKQYAQDGLLMSYSIDFIELKRRAAHYVDRILKGSKPRDLPAEQPTRFELVVNLATAKSLGIGVPSAILARADEVIE